MQKQNTGSSWKRQRLDTTGTRANKSSKHWNHLTQNASPHNMQCSTIWVHTLLPLSQGGIFNFQSHTTHSQVQRKMSQNSPPCWQWDSSSVSHKHSWRSLPLEWTSPWDATPPENMPRSASGVHKQASQVWYEHLQVLVGIVQRVANRLCIKMLRRI